MKNEFLPNGYDIPKSGGQYTKFGQGETRIRILEKPIIGNEFWVDRKPIRRRMGETISVGEVTEGDIKHFWAMFVYNYTEKRVQVMEITQKRIMTAINTYTKDSDFGSPLGYDLVIIREGEDLQTTYSVIAKPPKEIDPEITKVFQEVKDNGGTVEALFDGLDPYTGQPVGGDIKPVKKVVDEEEINIDSIPF